MSINWLANPKDTNFDAALSYLILVVGHPVAKRLVDKLHTAAIEEFAAKDILRAANTQALPLQTEHVQDNLKKMKKGQEIGPVLLCRVPGRPLIIADGMHRISAAWYLDEDTLVHALVAELKESI
jgi:hypothetical protein